MVGAAGILVNDDTRVADSLGIRNELNCRGHFQAPVNVMNDLCGSAMFSKVIVLIAFLSRASRFDTDCKGNEYEE